MCVSPVKDLRVWNTLSKVGETVVALVKKIRHGADVRTESKVRLASRKLNRYQLRDGFVEVYVSRFT